MTCIAAVQHRGKVWMGGDSAGTSMNFNQVSRGDKKVFINGKFIIGFSGSFRMGQLLAHKLEIPNQASGKSDMAFLIDDFMNSVKKALNIGEADLEPYFLFGYKGKLYEVQGDFQVGIPRSGYAAIGSGGDLAMGALHASQHVRNPERRILSALEAAEAGNAAVRSPFYLLKK